MNALQNFEYGLSPAAFALLIAYHIYLYFKLRRDPLSISMGLASRARGMWVRSVMENGRDILAVQTLRNWIMSATFLASTAILIGLGVFNVALTSERQSELSLVLNHLGSAHPGLWLAKLLLLGADFMFTFFNFAQAVRYYNHTGFMINLPREASDKIGIEDVTDFLNRGGVHYTLGMRGYYLALPLALWQFGPVWLMAGTLLLLVILYRIDRGV